MNVYNLNDINWDTNSLATILYIEIYTYMQLY